MFLSYKNLPFAKGTFLSLFSYTRILVVQCLCGSYIDGVDILRFTPGHGALVSKTDARISKKKTVFSSCHEKLHFLLRVFMSLHIS